MFGKLSRTLRGSQCDIYSESNFPDRRSQSVVNVKQRKHRTSRMGRLFGSDNEDEVHSVVSDVPGMYGRTDAPGMYGRSCSMNTLTEKKTKKKSAEGKFERVEKKMKSIQDSLGSISGELTTTTTAPRDISVLKKELELQDNFIQQLKRTFCTDRRNSKTSLEIKIKILNFERERKLRILTDKRKKLSRMKSNENIDACISAAELEFCIEREQVDVMSISQELQTVEAKLEREKRRTESLYQLAAQNPGLTLVCGELRERGRDVIGLRPGDALRPGGLTLNADVANFKEGDLVLELNGEFTLGLGEEDWGEVRGVEAPWRRVVGRGMGPHQGAHQGHQKPKQEDQPAELKGLQQDIALIQSRLEEKLKEGRDVSSVLGLVSKEKDNLVRENTRLNHRIFYLEEQVNDLQKSLRQVRDSLSRTLNTEIQDTLVKLDTMGIQNMVFQRGDHMASIEVPLDTVSSSSGVYSAGSEGSNSPDTQHVARLMVNQDKLRDRKRVERTNSRVSNLSNLVRLPFNRGVTQNHV